MARIFICYRREDSSGHAGRLYDRLGARFGDDVFMDIDAIGPGVEYAQLIDETIDTVEAVIVVIGQQWLSSTDGDGSRLGKRVTVKAPEGRGSSPPLRPLS